MYVFTRFPFAPPKILHYRKGAPGIKLTYFSASPYFQCSPFTPPFMNMHPQSFRAPSFQAPFTASVHLHLSRTPSQLPCTFLSGTLTATMHLPFRHPQSFSSPTLFMHPHSFSAPTHFMHPQSFSAPTPFMHSQSFSAPTPLMHLQSFSTSTSFMQSSQFQCITHSQLQCISPKFQAPFHLQCTPPYFMHL